MSVIDHVFETKGTHLFFVDTTGSAPVVRKLTCPTGITGVNGGTKDKIDTTCLDETGSFRTYIGGFTTPAEVAAPFILYKGDASHQALLAMQNSGAVVSWMEGLSDSAAYPTMDSNDLLVSPIGRTSFSWLGYVSTLTIEAATNEVIKGTLTIQRTGATTAHWAA